MTPELTDEGDKLQPSNVQPDSEAIHIDLNSSPSSVNWEGEHCEEFYTQAAAVMPDECEIVRSYLSL